MAGRTLARFARIYVDGYDLSGYARAFGDLTWAYDVVDLTTLADAVKGYLVDQPQISAGPFEVLLDNTATSGAHTLGKSWPGAIRTVTVALGDKAAPAQGVPTFNGQLEMSGYMSQASNGAATAKMNFAGSGVLSAQGFGKPWGWLLNAATTARTAVNSSSGVDSEVSAATSLGGYMAYQVLAGNGTATIKVQDSADNSTFADLSGATTGSISCSTPSAGVVALASTATVRRYLRWQIVLGTASTVTFVLSFVRNLV